MRLFIFFIFTFLMPIKSYGQYPYINHYDWMKPQLNPAALGINRTENVSMIYNRSWVASQVNSNLAILQYDRAFISNSNKNRGGIGASIANNRVNYKDVLNRFQASLSAAYATKVGYDAYLNFGLQGAYYADHVNNSGLLTGSQYVPGIGFDPGISSREPGSNLQVDYLGISTGVFLYQESEGILPDNYVGVSIKNMNRPVNSFFENDSRLSSQVNLMGGIKLHETVKDKLIAEALFSNSNQKGNLTIGGAYEIKYLGASKFSSTDAALRLVTRYSINNKFLVGGQLIYEQLVFGFTYDIKTKVTEKSYDSGFEFLIAFNRKLKQPKRKSKQKKQQQKAVATNTYKEVIQPLDTAESIVEPTVETLMDTVKIEEEKSGKATAGEVMDDPPIQNKIYFEFGSKEITAASIQHLRDLVVEFYSHEKNMIAVTGYTDNVGSEEFNMQLSMERAKSVKEKLMEFGLRTEQISVDGKGEGQPLFPNNSKENRAQNRRVEITFF